MKKHKVAIAVGVVLVLAVGIYTLLQTKKNAAPKIVVKNVDWLNGVASITVDGKDMTVDPTNAVDAGNGYSVSVMRDAGYVPVSVLLTKGGSIVSTIASKKSS